MKYKENIKVMRISTNQIFTIIGKKGSKRKIGCHIKREPIFELKGCHPSLDLLVRKSELDNLFIIV